MLSEDGVEVGAVDVDFEAWSGSEQLHVYAEKIGAKVMTRGPSGMLRMALLGKMRVAFVSLVGEPAM